MLVLASMTLTLMQGHSGSAKTKQINVECILSATTQAINIKLATTLCFFFLAFFLFFLRDLDLAEVYMACPSWSFFSFFYKFHCHALASSVRLCVVLKPGSVTGLSRHSYFVRDQRTREINIRRKLLFILHTPCRRGPGRATATVALWLRRPAS